MRPLLVALSLSLLLLASARAHAQAPDPRAWGAPGTIVPAPALPHAAPCMGDRCGARPLMRAPLAPRKRTRARFAHAGALLGVVSAGLVLGGSIAIAVVDDVPSERVTRGLWLGYVAVAPPLVAFSAWLARRESGHHGYRGLRRFGWVAYSSAIAHGIYQFYGALHDERTPRGLTVLGGSMAALALLPHALEAFMAGRHVRARRFGAHVAPTGTGFRVRF